MVFVAYNQSAKLSGPGNRSFDDPSARVSAHPSAILARGAFAILSMWRNEQKLLLRQFISEFITVISLICIQWCCNLWMIGLIYGFRAEFHLSLSAECLEHTTGIPVPSATTIHFVPSSMPGFSKVFAPFFCGSKTPVDEKRLPAHSTSFAQFIDEGMPHFKKNSRVIPLHHSSSASAE